MYRIIYFLCFFRTAFRSSERRQYSVPLLRDLGVASLIVIGRLGLSSRGGGGPPTSCLRSCSSNFLGNQAKNTSVIVEKVI